MRKGTENKLASEYQNREIILSAAWMSQVHGPALQASVSETVRLGDCADTHLIVNEVVSSLQRLTIGIEQFYFLHLCLNHSYGGCR